MIQHLWVVVCHDRTDGDRLPSLYCFVNQRAAQIFHRAVAERGERAEIREEPLFEMAEATGLVRAEEATYG